MILVVRSRRLASLLASTVLAVAGTSGMVHAPAFAQATTQVYDFNVPSKPIRQAINDIVRVTGIDVVFQETQAASAMGKPVRGRLTPQQAIAALLSGTGLSYSFSNASTVTISDRVAAAHDTQVNADGSLVLDTIDVTGANASNGSGFMGTPDRVYETPSSVSVVSGEAIRTSGARNIRDAIDASPGVYSGEGQGSFPTVSPNIRGVGDSGRVVVSIDGARQNAQDGGRYGGGMGGFGVAFVDPAFIREVDIDRNPGSYAGSAGALGGTVDFRTVNADDIIEPGKDWGAELNGVAGTNAFDYQGSLIASARIGEYFSLTGGISATKLGDYDPGKHGEAGSSTTYDMTGRETLATILKLEGDFGDVRTSFSWVHQQNDFSYSPTGTSTGSNFDATNDSVTANVAWDPDSPLINASALFWLNNSDVDETRAERSINGIVYDPETYQERDMLSFGAVLQNTSEVETAAGPIAFNYGVEAFRDDATSSVMNEDIANDPIIATGWLPYNRPGQRDVVSTFFNGKWEPSDWMTVSGGLSYDWYRLKGTGKYYSQETIQETVTIPCDPVTDHYDVDSYWTEVFLLANPTWNNPARETIYRNVLWPNSLSKSCMPGTGVTTTTTDTIYPEHEFEIDRTDGAWLPSATVEFKPTEWLRPYVSYAHSMRPPTTNEAFFYGSIIPANGAGTSAAPNPNLRAEKARTWEAGVNVMRDGVFVPDDAFRFKAAAFHRTIEDYIVLGYIRTADVLTRDYESFVNAADDTTMYGLELEANYDAGSYWIGGSATWLETRWPGKTDISSNDGGTTTGDILAIAGAAPPRFKATIDAGIRLFDRKLSLGARLNHATPNQIRYLDQFGNLSETGDAYTTVDLRGAFTFGQSTTLNVTVNNVTDQRYIPATGNYLAPGRTFTAGLNFKF